MDDPQSLWCLLDEWRAVVGGLGALSFFLSDPSLLPECLDIYLSEHHSPMLEWIIPDMEELDMVLVAQIEARGDLPAHVYRSCVFETDTGCHIRLLWSDGDSVLLPITAAPTTALFNFVGAVTFGCAYPSLTFRRRGFRRNLGGLSTQDLADLAFLQSTGDFTLRTILGHTGIASGKEVYPCQRAVFLCPRQGRFFGDNGTLIQGFAPHRTLHRALRRRHHAPYGFATIWRFSTTRTLCDGPCTTHDPLLPDRIISISVLLIGRGILLNNSFVGWRTLYNDIPAPNDER